MSRSQGMALLITAVIGAVPMAGVAQIQEIIVTTRKKEESLQDVPISVSAITAEQIERQGVADLNDVVKATPSVQFDRSYGPSDTRITIRGLSNSRGRSNVAFLVDGIDVTTENLIVAGSGLLANRRLLTDVQRIEIVKGPQSALYGRAAFAGAINYITKEPGDVFEGTSKIDFAQDGFQQVDGAFGGPLSDTLGMRVTGYWFNQDGHYVNSLSGDDVGGSGGSGAALTAVWRPNDVAKIKMRTEYSKEDFDPLANLRIGGGWQNGEGIQLLEYPDGMLEHATNMVLGIRPDGGNEQNGLGFNKGSDSTGILDFNQYCPPELRNADKGPGFCLPTTFGSAKNRVIKQSENPLTGEDFDGTDLETFRFSVIAEFDMDGGVLTSYTGWTDFNAHDTYDQDWQAESIYKFTPFGGTAADYAATPAPAFYNGRRPDQLLAGQVANTDSTVDQFSQEFRFASRLDGPWQYTVGALFWDETRGLDDRNGIYACMPIDKIGRLDADLQGNPVYPTFVYQPGVCDGTPATFVTGSPPTVIGWQDQYRNIQPQPAGRWEADTRHWSFYVNLAWELAENWTLEFEDRFVSENFRLLKPNQTLCTNLGYAAVIGQAFLQEVNGVDTVCALEKVTTEGVQLTSNDSLRSFEATVTSHFSTPKATLRWQVTPDNQLYFFWAKAQKPGGINQLASGANPVTLEFEAFDPEKLTAWELGSKNTFEFFGALQANAAMFLQDYTDKQVSTQVVVDGVSAPKVLNASGAEIWGLELEFLWQPEFVEGLTLNLAYTYLDAEYTKFLDDVTSPQRLAYAYSAGRSCELIYKDGNDQVVPFDADQFGAAPDNTYLPSCRVDYSGAKLERTPEHAVAMSASYQRPLLDTGLDLLAELNANWQDERYLDQDNGVVFDAYWLLDARLGLVHPKYEIIAYVDNLLDDDTIRSGGSGPDFAQQVSETGFTAGLGVSHFFGTLPDPRIFGIRATYRFGEQ